MSTSDLFKFLFEDSQSDSQLESFAQELAEEINSAERLQAKKTPLKKALGDIGVELSYFELEECPDISGYVLTTTDGDSYKNAHRLLNSPDGMHALAELGWFFAFGDRDATDGELSIFFSEILGDEEPSDTEELVDIEKLAKDSYEFVNQGLEPREDEKSTNDKSKGVGKSKDGEKPKGVKESGGAAENKGGNEDWISEWAEKNGSAVEIWGEPELHQAIYNTVNAGGEVRSFIVGAKQNSTLRDQANAIAEKYAQKGYKELAFEDNYDQGELLLSKQQ